MATTSKTKAQLIRENAELRARLQEAEESLTAIRTGRVDALLIDEHIDTLQSAGTPYRAFVEAMNEGAATVRHDGTILFCNRRLAEMLKCSPQELAGSSLRRFIASTNLGSFDLHIAQTQPDRIDRDEFTFVCADATAIPVQLSFSQVIDRKVSGVCIVATDLTDRQKAEVMLKESEQSLEQRVKERTTELISANQSLRESERRFKLALRNAPISIAVQDRDLRFVWNYNQLTVPSSAELAGKTDADLFIPEEADQLIALKRKVLETGQEAHDQLWITRGNARFFLNVYIEALRGDDGEIDGIGIATVDLTNQKVAEEALEEARMVAVNERNRLQALMEALPVGVAIVNREGGNIGSNHAFEDVWGGSRPGAQTLADYHAYKAWWLKTNLPIDPDQWASIRAVREGVAVIGQSMEIERFDGTHAFVLNSAAPIFDDQGEITGSAVAIMDITDRIKAETALKESEERYHSLFAKMTEGFALHEVICNELGTPIDYVFLDVNPAFEQLTGLKREDVIGKTHSELLPNDDPKWVKIYGEVALSGRSVHFDNFSPALKRAYEVFAYRSAPRQFAVLFTDVTDRKKRELELQRLNRTLKALSDSNHALMRAEDETKYLNEICRIIVEDCDHAMVWIGFAEEDDAKTVHPVASAGFEAGYLETLHITWGDSERGRGPTGTAIRAGTISTCSNMQTDPLFVPWRPEATKRGYASSIALPLKDQGKPFGAITIYSREPDSFSADEIRLLEELAEDLSYGITALRLQAAHARAEEALRRSEERYRGLVEMSPDAIIISRDNHTVFVNPAALRLLGASCEEEILGKSPYDFIHPEYHQQLNERISQTLAGNPIDVIEEKIVRLDGTVRDVESVATRMYDAVGPAIQVILRDVTERKAADRRIQHLASFPEMNPDVIIELDRRGTVTYANPATWRTLHELSLEENVSLFLPQDLRSIQTSFRPTDEPEPIVREVSVKNRTYFESITYARVSDTIRIYATDITDRKLMEKSLRGSEERLLQAQKAGHVGVYDRSFADGKVTWTDELKSIYGVPPDFDVKPDSWTALIHPHDLPLVQVSFNRALASRRNELELEYRIIRPDGNLRWLTDRGFISYDASGKPSRVIGTRVDITVHKQAVEKLREGERVFRRYAVRLVLTLALSILVSDSLTVILLSMLGPLSLWVDTLLDSILMLILVSPTLYAFMLRPLTKLLKQRDHAEEALRRSHEDLEMRVKDRTASLQRANEKLEEEIAVRRKAEEALRQSEERFRSAVETMADGFAIFPAIRDSQHRIVDFEYAYVNEAGCILNQRTATEQLGHTLLELLPAHKETGLFDKYVNVVETGLPLSEEALYEDEFGGGKRLSRAFEYRAVKLGDGFAVIWRDISHRKQAEAETARHLENMRFISETATSFLKDQTEEEVFPYIAGQIAGLARECVVVVNEFDPDKNCTILRAIGGDEQRVRALEAMFDNNLIGLCLPFDLATRQRMKEGTLVKVDGGMYDLTFRALPEERCREIETALDLGDMFAMPFAWEQDFLGTVAVLTRGHGLPENAQVIETFVSQAATTLKRIRTEKERKRLLVEAETNRDRAESFARDLQNERKVLEAIMENTKAQLAYIDPEFNFVIANSAYALGSGVAKEDLIGRNHFELFPNDENKSIFESVRASGEAAEFLAKPFEFSSQPWRGATYWDWTLVPVKDDGGRLQGLVFSLVDVTDYKRAQGQRERSLARLHTLLRVSEKVLAEKTPEEVLKLMVDAARELTGAESGAGGYSLRGKGFEIYSKSGRRIEYGPARESLLNNDTADVFLELVQERSSFRLSVDQLRTQSFWTKLPGLRDQLRGLTGSKLFAREGKAVGIVVVANREDGEFSPEDEALLTQLAALVSLSLQHIGARSEAERRAGERDAIVNAISDAVLVTDTDGAPSFVNAALVRSFGFDPLRVSPEEAARRLTFRRRDGTPIDRGDLPMSRARRGESVIAEQCVVQNVQGLDFIMRVSSSPLRLGGRHIGEVTVLHDVTERELLIQKLGDEQSKLKAIIDNAPEGIIFADESSRIIMANPVAERLYGRPVPVGLRYHEQSNLNQCYPDGKEYDPRDLPLTRSALDGETVIEQEIAALLPDGRLRPLLMNSAPVRGTNGQIIGAVGLVQDITRRKETEETLRRNAEDYRRLVEEATDGILLLSESGAINTANARLCEMLGYSKEELLASTLRSVLHFEGTPDGPIDLEHLAPGKVKVEERRMLTKSGMPIDADLRVKKLSNGLIQATFRDITAQKEQQEKFRKAIKEEVYEKLLRRLRAFKHGQSGAMNLNRLALFADNLEMFSGAQGLPVDDRAPAAHAGKDLLGRITVAVDEFSSTVSPELKHIASLAALVDIGISESSKATEIHLAAEELPSLADRLQQKLGSVQLLAGAESSENVTDEYPALQTDIVTTIAKIRYAIHVISSIMESSFTSDVSAVVKTTVQKFALASSELSITFADHTPGIKVVFDTSELAEVMSILIENAIEALSGVTDATRQGTGAIRVLTATNEGKVRITVEDNGPGVVEAIRASLFQDRRSTKTSGGGFGLNYARECVTKYGGQISLDQSWEQGARFIIEIPKA